MNCEVNSANELSGKLSLFHLTTKRNSVCRISNSLTLNLVACTCMNTKCFTEG